MIDYVETQKLCIHLCLYNTWNMVWAYPSYLFYAFLLLKKVKFFSVCKPPFMEILNFSGDIMYLRRTHFYMLVNIMSLYNDVVIWIPRCSKYHLIMFTISSSMDQELHKGNIILHNMFLVNWIYKSQLLKTDENLFVSRPWATPLQFSFVQFWCIIQELMLGMPFYLLFK